MHQFTKPTYEEPSHGLADIFLEYENLITPVLGPSEFPLFVISQDSDRHSEHMADHSLLSQAGQVPSTQKLRGLLPVVTQSWHSPGGISLWDPALTTEPILLDFQCHHALLEHQRSPRSPCGFQWLQSTYDLSLHQ